MKQIRCLLCFLATLVLTAAAHADLARDVRAVLAEKLLAKGDVSIQIMRLGSSPAESKTIYEHKSRTPRIPASNLKLVATAAAMDKLGADFEFKTTLAARGRDLALIGDGDPTLGDAEMLRKLGWDVDTVFKSWAQLLVQNGITRVENLYVDDSIFDEQFLHPNWPPEQQHKRYVPQVAGVNLNANCLDFYLRVGGPGQTVEYRHSPATAYATVGNTCVTGTRNAVWLSRQPNTNDIVLRGETNASNTEPISVTIHDPAMFAATVLAETLAAHGVKMTGTVQRDRTIRESMLPGAAQALSAEPWKPLAVHSTPLSVALVRANKDSMNLYAEALCKRIGAALSGRSGTWENGTIAMGMFLELIGANRDEFSIDDGSGLSKKNSISANAIARVLEHQFHDAGRDLFIGSLAVSGTDGTFESRFRDSDLRGRVFGKSGYVVGVSSLSGYLHAKDGQWYAFSIIMNGLPEGTNGVAKQLQERIVKAIDVNAASVAAGR